MRNTKQNRRQAKELFRNCLVNGLLDEERARQAVRSLIELKPRGYLGILSFFQRRVKLALENRLARIETAAPLDDAQKRQWQERLTKLRGPGLEFVFRHNPELLGGARIRVGSDVYENSIQSRLAALQDQF